MLLKTTNLRTTKHYGTVTKNLDPPESEYRSFLTQVLGAFDFFLEVGLAVDVRSITLEGFDSVFALLRLYSNTSCLAAKLGHLLGRLEACVSVG